MGTDPLQRTVGHPTSRAVSYDSEKLTCAFFAQWDDVGEIQRPPGDQPADSGLLQDAAARKRHVPLTW